MCVLNDSLQRIGWQLEHAVPTLGSWLSGGLQEVHGWLGWGSSNSRSKRGSRAGRDHIGINMKPLCNSQGSALIIRNGVLSWSRVSNQAHVHRVHQECILLQAPLVLDQHFEMLELLLTFSKQVLQLLLLLFKLELLELKKKTGVVLHVCAQNTLE
jgi:hypothetical protein